MRILVTGADGQLGRALRRSLAVEELIALGHAELDVADARETMKAVGELGPDVVIHTAAYTNVDGCETRPDLAYLINGTGTRNVALACARYDAGMVYISTDYVFDGTKGIPYVETDVPNPISIYGRSKLEGERHVQSLLARYCIVRTSWVYANTGKNFVKTILSLARRGPVSGVTDEIGCPTFARDLADGLARLALLDFNGVYHLSNEGACSRYEWVRSIIELAGLAAPVRTVTAEQFLAECPLPARRPRNSTLENSRAADHMGIVLRPWRDALAEMLRIENGQ